MLNLTPFFVIKINTLSLVKNRSLTALLGASLLAASALFVSAESVVTVPVGAVTLTANAAPSLSSPRYTSLAIPLLNPPIQSGRIGSFTANSITVQKPLEEVVGPSNPYFIRILSGPNQGLSLPISSNNGTVLVVDTSKTGSLTALSNQLSVGVVGDTYSVYPLDTLSSLFGSLPQGASSPNEADQVWIWQPAAGSYAKFYYNIISGRWQDTDFDDPADNVVLLPDVGFMYVRRATTPISFVLIGSVPSSDGTVQIRNSGFMLLSTGFPAPMTLMSIGLHDNPNWVKADNFAIADQVWIWQSISGSYAKFFYNSGTARWEDSDFGDSANSVIIHPETPVMIKRFAVGKTAYTPYSITKPYSL